MSERRRQPLDRLVESRAALDVARVELAGVVYKLQHGAHHRGGEQALLRDLCRLSRDLSELLTLVDGSREQLERRLETRADQTA